jgi:hypothetical protein
MGDTSLGGGSGNLGGEVGRIDSDYLEDSETWYKGETTAEQLADI